VTGPYATAVIVASLVLCAGAIALLVADKSPGPGAWWLLGALEVGVLGFVAWGVASLVTTTEPVPVAELVGYLFGLAVAIPAAAWWIRDERTRAAAGVLVVVLLVVPFLVVRVQQIWAGAGG